MCVNRFKCESHIFSYSCFTFTWQNGRRLATAAANGKSLSFEYDDSGYRTQKKVNGVATDYLLDGDKIVSQIYNNQQIWFDYDAAGTRHAMEYNGNNYYYYYNLQGDVIGLYDSDLNSVVQYSYDSWGKLLSVTGSLAETVGKANPFRYRGYYYDSETELYYLNSRYYDPETGRFINADGYVSTGQGTLTHNMFAYCLNNPVNLEDLDGEMAGAASVLAWGAYAGGANSWNPAGWIILGVTVIAAVAIWVIPWDSIGRSVANVWNKVKNSTKATSISLSISKAVLKAKVKIRNERRRYDYWIASYVDYGDGRGAYIPTTPLSYSRAVSYVRGGGSVFADSIRNAYKLAKAVGGGIPKRHKAHGGLGYWRHYHATRRGRLMKGHIFYV